MDSRGRVGKLKNLGLLEAVCRDSLLIVLAFANTEQESRLKAI
jgi:hypothetical protein